MVWTPSSEDELRAALDEGNVRENSALDFKREIGTGDGSRRATAIDLASFAVYGGQLIVGVAEEKTARSFTLTPQLLTGAAEKLEDIAANRIDPPLFIRVSDIPSSGDPTIGYLIVEIPPSSSAPHMVDGRYYARGDRTNRRLTDAEVLALHSARRRTEDDLKETLENWAAREIVPSDKRRNGHLHLIAEPLLERNPAAFQSISRAQEPGAARSLVYTAEAELPTFLRAFEPRLSSASRWRRRADGGALTGLDAGLPALGADGWEDSLVDLELRDNGGFRILMGRHTDLTQDRGVGLKIIFDMASLGYAWTTVLLARGIAEQTGYRGPWGFGVSADRLGGKRSWALLSDETVFTSAAEPYAARGFIQVTTAQLQEMEDAPGAVAARLVGRLLHGLGSYELLTG